MRKNYIDNLRWMCILLLFPYHTCRIFSSNDLFYIQGKPSNVMTAFVYACMPWFMPLLFAIAGMSTRYALNKRTLSQYAGERVKRLLIPFVAGLILLIPLQTYYANKFFNGFSGNIFEQYKVFFTTVTDLSGYDGGLTPGHLWFILYLFGISMVAIIPIALIKKRDIIASKLNNIFFIVLLGILVLGMNYVGDLGGKSIGKYFTLFIIGFFVLSDDKILETIKKYRIVLLVIWLALNVTYVSLNIALDKDVIPLQIITGWFAILALLGIGQSILNFSNKYTKYLSTSSFPVYIFHQTILVAIGFYVLKLNVPIGLKALIICISTLISTFGIYEIIKRIPGVRFLFGIKSKTNKKINPQTNKVNS